MRYKVDVMTGSKREAAGIGDGASKLKLTQQKQQNARLPRDPLMRHNGRNDRNNKFNYTSQC